MTTFAICSAISFCTFASVAITVTYAIPSRGVGRASLNSFGMTQYQTSAPECLGIFLLLQVSPKEHNDIHEKDSTI